VDRKTSTSDSGTQFVFKSILLRISVLRDWNFGKIERNLTIKITGEVLLFPDWKKAQITKSGRFCLKTGRISQKTEFRRCNLKLTTAKKLVGNKLQNNRYNFKLKNNLRKFQHCINFVAKQGGSDFFEKWLRSLSNHRCDFNPASC